MDKGGSSPNIPNAPSLASGYNQGTNLYLGNLDRYLNTEMGSRSSQDPQRIAEQQGLQSQFGPNQYNQQLSALRQLDPAGYNLRQQTAGMLSNNLSAGTGLTPGMDQSLSQDIERTQAARGNVYGQAPVQNEAFTKGMYGQQLQQQNIQNALQFQNSQSPESQINQISPVSADRSMAYVNPNAGFLGINASNAGFQNQLGAAGLSMQPQNNSWMSALGGLASAVGPALGMAFSDPRLKSNVSKVGSANGHNLYKYDIQEPKRTEIGVMADEVAAKRPDAVAPDPVSGYMKVMYPKLGMRGPVQVGAGAYG